MDHIHEWTRHLSEGKTISTLGDLIDNDYRLNGSCYPCKRFQPIDVEALAKRLGRDFVYVGNLNGRLTCKVCKQRTVTVTIDPPTSARPE